MCISARTRALRPSTCAESAPQRDQFYTKVAGKDSAQVKAIWARLVFTGKSQPPKEAGSSAEAVKQVASNDKGIAYVDKSAVDALGEGCADSAVGALRAEPDGRLCCRPEDEGAVSLIRRSFFWRLEEFFIGLPGCCCIALRRGDVNGPLRVVRWWWNPLPAPRIHLLPPSLMPVKIAPAIGGAGHPHQYRPVRARQPRSDPDASRFFAVEALWPTSAIHLAPLNA